MESDFKAPKDDLRMEVKVKNNILYQAITSKYGNVSAFCRDAKARGYSINPSLLGRLINFQDSPFLENSLDYRNVCLLIERALGIPAEELFPAKLYKRVKVSKEVITFNSANGPLALAMRQVHLLPGSKNMQPEIRMLSSEMKEEISKMLDSLNTKQSAVIKLLYGLDDGIERSQREVAKVLGISQARVGQLELIAMGRLRKPFRAKKLIDFVP